MYITSGPALVIAQCQSGIIGTFPAAGARSLAQLSEWLVEIEEALAKWDRENPSRPSAPYGVNQIVYKTNDRLEEDLALCADHKVPIVINSLGAREDINRVVREYGGITLHDVIDNRFARKAIEKGAVGLVAVATGAGGHTGRYSPFPLVREIREWFDGPLALGGAIMTGEGILAAQAIGADFAYIGSAFMATTEATGSDQQKRCIVESSAEDIMTTDFFTGVNGNYLRPSIIAAGFDPDNLPTEKQVMDLRSGGKSQAKIWRDIWGCGQGIGPIKEVAGAAQLIDRLESEYRAAFNRLSALQSEGRASRPDGSVAMPTAVA